MINLNVPRWVTKISQKPLHLSDYTIEEIAILKEKLARFHSASPLVSVVIPAWNEEEGILPTLHSLAGSVTEYETELIIVDNNSTDGTAALLRTLGVKTLMETKQGIGYARSNGLLNAKGKYILTGDSDTLYHPGWIDAMTKAMINGKRQKVFCVHGTYSFLPGSNTPRWQYGCYEMMSSIIIKKKEKTQPFLNVLGFNCGFIRQKGIDVNGYHIETQRMFRGAAGVLEENATEDGMMALRLQQAGGKIKAVHNNAAKVWTSDRRIQLDGGIKKAFNMRIKKHLLKK